MKTNDGQPITLRDVAYHVLSQSPEQLGQMQTRNAQQAAGHQIGALHQEIQGLKSTLQEMHHAQQFTYTRSAVDQFADQHPRFDELGDLIEAELKYGFDLPTAYQRASLLRPSTQAAQTRNPPAQTRQDKSIYGAPDSGSSNGSVARKPDKTVGRRDAIQDAIRRVNGGFA
jgi:TolA-binding protein